jgi:hypothetical protein
VDAKHGIAGFKAILESHKTNAYELLDRDGKFRVWRDLTAECKVEYILRDAAFYDVAFVHFADAVRGSVDKGAIEESALRLAMRTGRELHNLEKLFPDGGLTEPPSLAERVRELLGAESPGQEIGEMLAGDKLAAVFKEMRTDEAARKGEDAHRHRREALEHVLGGTTEPAAPEKSKDLGVER